MTLKINIITHHSQDNQPTPSPIAVDSDQRIGRDSTCDIILPCQEKTVSRHHAEILCREDQYFFIDCSTNGSFRNDDQQPLASNQLIQIANNDQFHIGHYSLCCSVVPAQSTPSHADLGLDSPNSLVLDEPAAENLPIKDSAYNIQLSSIQSKGFSSDPLPPASPSPENVSDDLSAQTPVSSVPITGALSESFSPPRAYIPEDWANTLDLTPPPAETSSHTPSNNNTSATPKDDAQQLGGPGALADAGAEYGQPSNTPPYDYAHPQKESPPESPGPLPGSNLDAFAQQAPSPRIHNTASQNDLLKAFLEPMGISLPEHLSHAQAEERLRACGKLMHLMLTNHHETARTQDNLLCQLLDDERLIAQFEQRAQTLRPALVQSLLTLDPAASAQKLEEIARECGQQQQDFQRLNDTVTHWLKALPSVLSSEKFEQAFQAKDALSRNERSPLHRAMAQRNQAQRRWSFFRDTWDQKVVAAIEKVKTELHSKLLADRNKKQRR